MNKFKKLIVGLLMAGIISSACIEASKKRKHEDKKENSNKRTKEIKLCSICQNDLIEEPSQEQIATFSPTFTDDNKEICAHSFHFKCIMPWLAINPSCPTCRTPATTFQEEGACKLLARQTSQAIQEKEFDTFTDLILHHADQANDERMLAQILLGISDHLGQTALHIAANSGYTDIVILLLAHPMINRNATNNDGFTALHCAAFHGRETCLQLLLVGNNSINARDVRGNTALDWALRNNHTTCIEILRRAGAISRSDTPSRCIIL